MSQPQTPKQSNWDIGYELGQIKSKLDQLVGHTTKMMFAMLGIIAATVGVKFIGTPARIHLMSYAVFFAAAFLLATVAFQWRKHHWTRRLVRLCFVVFILFSTIVRTVVYEAAVERAPTWYPPIIDSFFILLSILLVLSAWKDK